MKDKVKRFSLLLLSAAMISSSLPSCSKSGDTGPTVTTAQSEQTGTETTAAETTAAAEEKPEETSAVTKKEKKSKETTAKKKKKKSSTSSSAEAAVTTEEFTEPEDIYYEPSAIERFVDKETGFFSDNAISLLGLDKESVLGIITYNEDYMIMNDPDDDGTEIWEYVVDARSKYSMTLVFADDKLREFSCSSKFSDFNTALSFAKTMGWERDESQTVKGKRAFKVTGKDALYKIYKTKDDEAGQAFITQSYVLSD